MPVVTLNGVPAEVVSVRERVGDRGLTAAVVYRTDWSARHRFLLGLAGDVELIGDPGTGTIRRVVPHKYPDAVDLQADLYALEDTIEIEPEGPIRASDGWVTFGNIGPGNGKARIGVTYGYLDFNPEDENIYNESMDGAGQFLTLPGVPIRFKGTSIRINQDAAIFMPQTDIQREYLNIPYFDEALLDLRGRVNDDVFRGKPIGTMLLARVAKRSQRTALGRELIQATLNFIHRDIPWNYLLRTDTGVWAEAESIAGLPLYAYASFAHLE